MAPLRGMTWDHPRGYRVLDELARGDAASGTGPATRWARQSLADFESRPVREFAGHTDLVVLDHPGLGEAIADGCLRPLDELVGADELAAWRASSVGPSFDSYRVSGRQWALPIDAATQVGVLATGERAPETWHEAVGLARTARTTLCLGGPHALLMFSAVCVALGGIPASRPDRYVDRTTGAAALAVLRELFGHADPALSLENPITVLDAMSAVDGPDYCPLVYGYLSYQLDRPRPLRALDAPAGAPGGRRGSVLGGTGIAVTTSCRDSSAAARELRRLCSATVQGTVYAELGGQSATTAGWDDETIDRHWRGFYRSTRRTLDQAWVRPRFAGYLPFQRDGSALVRAGLVEPEPDERVLDRLDHAYRKAAGT